MATWIICKLIRCFKIDIQGQQVDLNGVGLELPAIVECIKILAVNGALCCHICNNHGLCWSYFRVAPYSEYSTKI